MPNWRTSEHEIVEAMIHYGGSFASKLGLLYRAADTINQGRLLVAFRDLFEDYDEMAVLIAQRNAQTVKAAQPQGDGDPGDCDPTGLSQE